jgi:prepilin peptidase CpaA
LRASLPRCEIRGLPSTRIDQTGRSAAKLLPVRISVTFLHLQAALVLLFVIVAAALDLGTKKIPNWITVPAALAGLAFHAAAPAGSGILWALAGFAVGFSLLLLPWLLGGGGMGDVKLLAALGVWLGPLTILIVFGASAVIGAVMAAGVMVGGMFTRGITATRRRYLNLDEDQPSRDKGSKRGRRVIPFAVPIAISTVVVLALMLVKASVQP